MNNEHILILKEAFFMITFCIVTETPRQPETPEWMREERYMYCDQAAANISANKNVFQLHWRSWAYMGKKLAKSKHSQI